MGLKHLFFVSYEKQLGGDGNSCYVFRMIRLLSLCLFFLLSFSVAQDKAKTYRDVSNARPFHFPLTPLPAPQELKTNIDSFFGGLVEGNATKAFDGFVKGQPLAEKEEELKFMINMTQQALTLYGKSTANELIDTKSAGARLMTITYLTHHQKAPLRWKIICYKPQTSWIIIDIVFDDGFKEWFQ